MLKQEILVLGSGSITAELLSGIMNFKTSQNLSIIVVSNDPTTLTLLAKEFKVKTIVLNVIKDKELLIKLIKDSVLIISLLPDEFQYLIALYCLEGNRNLLSTSNISDEISNLNTEVKKKGLLFLFECGCNPGIDHLISAKVINEARRRSAKIVHYENWSGAIPSPESMDNPFLFKLTNSSLESLKSMVSDSTQLKNKRVKHIKEKDLLDNLMSSDNFHLSFNFEGYYTKNYLKYKNYYNLKYAETILIGSVRYKGFSFIIQAFKYLKLFSSNIVEVKYKTWRDYFAEIITDPRNESILYNIHSTYVPRNFRFEKLNSNLNSDRERFFYFRLACYALSFFDRNFISKHGFEDLFNRLYSVLVFFKFYNIDNLITPSVTMVKAFSILLENTIQMKSWERDLVYLKNVYRFKSFSGREIEKTYELIMYGKVLSNSGATAYLVGRTCAVGAHCILTNKFNNLSGVCIPFDELIADEVINQLLKEDIKIYEKTRLITKF